jgi:exodeoxyribonuclease-3
MEWEDDFRAYISDLNKLKPVVISGDLNVAHKEIDLKNPKTNTKNPGFTEEEREKITMLLESGLTDSYRHINPDKEGAYTWWSFRTAARSRNIGWRIDYFLVSERLNENIADVSIYSQIMGSDHCPVGLSLRI